MKILMFMPSYRGGGAERVFVNLANYLSEYHEVVLIVCSEEGPNKLRLNDEIKTISCNKNSIFLCFFEIRKTIKKLKPDVFFSNTISCNALAILVKKSLSFFLKYDLKVVCREANVVNYNDFKSKIRNFIAFSVYEFADALIFNSLDTHKSVLKCNERIGKVTSKVISNPAISDSYTVKDTFTRGSKDDVRVISVGRLSKQKNLNLAIESINYLKKKGVSVYLDIYGVGDLETSLLKLIEEYNLQDRVILKGYGNNLHTKYSSYDVFLLTSLWEGFGNVIVESLASGLPVVATNSKGGVPELLKDPGNGSIVEFDPKSIALAIQFEINNNNLTKTNNRVDFSHQFSLENIGTEYRLFIESVL